jgi:signal transduction histidine kinase
VLAIGLKSLKNKLKDFFNSVKSKLPAVSLKKYKISLSTQIIFTIFLVFVSFFIMQSILNSQFFHNYYTDREFENVNDSILTYVNKMNASDSDYYEEMYEYVTSHNAYSIITTKAFRVFESSYTDYTISITNDDNDQTYTFLVPDNTLVFSLNDNLSISISPYNDEYYYPFSIQNDDTLLFESTDTCPSTTCMEISGTVTEIHRPNNLNFQFSDNLIVQNELSKLSSGYIDFSEHQYEDGYWYKSTDNAIDTLVFIHELKNWDYIITIVPIEDTTTIIDIVSQYNYYVYLTAIAIIFLWSFRLSAIISKPIQHIDMVAKDIANLHFTEIANEYSNKETASLSNSINLISSNLKDALETLNNKNNELTTLYEEQSKQVELKKRLVSSISHELKTPLMIMQVIVQGISDGVIEEKDIHNELATVLSEINKSSMMIQDMLQIYRLDDSETILDISEFNITKEVSYLLHEFEQIVNKQSLNINFNKEENIFVEADIKLIRRVISNFLTNAIRYTPIGGRIDINLTKSNDSFTFEIINYGVNIHKNELENIWLPFYRGSQKNYADQKQSGSGIGLYLVKEILQAHKADFGIQNINDSVKAFFTLSQKNDS